MLPVDEASADYESSILLIETCNLPLKASNIAQSTRADPVLAKVLQGLITGRNLYIHNDECKPYKAI